VDLFLQRDDAATLRVVRPSTDAVRDAVKDLAEERNG
jgi:hypothetical protein